MTVLIEGSFTPLCSPPPPLPKLGGMSFVKVVDRSRELSLMDSDVRTCLAGTEQGRKSLHLTAYIYTPNNVTSLRVALNTSGMACSGPGLLVYHKVTANGIHSDILFEECTVAVTGDIGDVLQQCEFVCHNLRLQGDVVKLGIRMQNLSWKFKASGKLCGVVVTRN